MCSHWTTRVASYLTVCTAFLILFRIDRKNITVISYNSILNFILNRRKPWKKRWWRHGHMTKLCLWADNKIKSANQKTRYIQNWIIDGWLYGQLSAHWNDLI